MGYFGHMANITGILAAVDWVTPVVEGVNISFAQRKNDKNSTSHDFFQPEHLLAISTRVQGLV